MATSWTIAWRLTPKRSARTSPDTPPDASGAAQAPAARPALQIVLCGRHPDVAFPVVDIDNLAAARSIVEHVAAPGYLRIGWDNQCPARALCARVAGARAR